MHVFLIILAVMLWALAGIALFIRQRVAPVLSFAALSVLSFARTGGLQIIPVNTVMLLGWFAITLIVTIVTVIQPPVVQAQRRGVGYMAAGGVAGLAASAGVPEGIFLYSFTAQTAKPATQANSHNSETIIDTAPRW